MGTTRKFDPSEPVLAHLANLKTGLHTLHTLGTGLAWERARQLDDAIVGLVDRVQEIERKILELPAFTLHPLARARIFGDMFDPPYHAGDTDDLAVGDLAVDDAIEYPDDVVSEHGLRTDRQPRERVCVLELAIGSTSTPDKSWWQAQYRNGESVRVLAGPHRGRTGVITSVGLMSYEVDLDPVGS